MSHGLDGGGRQPPAQPGETREIADRSTTGIGEQEQSQPLVVTLPPDGIALAEIERQAIIEALRMSNGVQKAAAELLRISPRKMNYKIRTVHSIRFDQTKKRYV